MRCTEPLAAKEKAGFFREKRGEKNQPTKTPNHKMQQNKERKKKKRTEKDTRNVQKT